MPGLAVLRVHVYGFWVRQNCVYTRHCGSISRSWQQSRLIDSQTQNRHALIGIWTPLLIHFLQDLFLTDPNEQYSWCRKTQNVFSQSGKTRTIFFFYLKFGKTRNILSFSHKTKNALSWNPTKPERSSDFWNLRKKKNPRKSKAPTQIDIGSGLGLTFHCMIHFSIFFSGLVFKGVVFLVNKHFHIIFFKTVLFSAKVVGQFVQKP